ncbi:MAG: cell division protein FtsA [Candidatus Nomurabacteria bacterium]|jgi:cell division protein FtsA|nr:cell division protein FtsA [Candidatus Nomurabacteria bacterium]
MEEAPKHAVGIDIGTSSVRVIVASISGQKKPVIVGHKEVENSGMRKGMVVNLEGPAKAIDAALLDAEKMSGYRVDSAVVNVNGAHILCTRTNGMIAVGAMDHEITAEDVRRVEDMATTTGEIPANREVLALIPYGYRLDGQGGIKNPIGMNGTRLEMNAGVVSGLTPLCQNVRKTAELSGVFARKLVASSVAAANAVLTEKQMENGVAVIDFGFATTSIAIFEEGDLQWVSVVPLGSNNVTNDLAICLQTSPEVAEDLKRRVSATGDGDSDEIAIGKNRTENRFKKTDIQEVIGARLDEIFDLVRKEFKKAGYDRRLPEGVVLVGGGAKLRDIDVYAKTRLELAVKIGTPMGLSGTLGAVAKPEFATAIGLAFEDILTENVAEQKRGAKSGGGLFKKIWAKITKI